MHIGVYIPSNLPISINNYTKNIVRELKNLGVDFSYITEKSHIPRNVDIFWDPRCGRPGPVFRLTTLDKPNVVTFHGAAHLALPIEECFGATLGSKVTATFEKLRTKLTWHQNRNSCSAVITVSEYAKDEFKQNFSKNQAAIISIYHGVDHNIFFPIKKRISIFNYFLHVSSYQPKKNIHRIIDAYSSLNCKNKPHLLLVSPGFNSSINDSKIELLRNPLSQNKLAKLYQNATAFIFPSLHETFGLPIIEAMASGCPVITSNNTACSEIAGDAALLVNPRSTMEISQAINKLLNDRSLCQKSIKKGLDRARLFSWEKSAKYHLKVFENVLGSQTDGIRK